MSLWKQLPKLAAAFGLALVLAGCGVNTIPTKDQAVKARWADVQAAYQRRADLIPNLANTVAAYAKQEQTVLTAVTQARASATQVKVDVSTITDPAKFAEFQQAQDKTSIRPLGMAAGSEPILCAAPISRMQLRFRPTARRSLWDRLTNTTISRMRIL